MENLYLPVASLGGGVDGRGPPWVTPFWGWHTNEVFFCGYIYKNGGQTISWKGGEAASGDGSVYRTTSKKVITLSLLFEDDD